MVERVCRFHRIRVRVRDALNRETLLTLLRGMRATVHARALAAITHRSVDYRLRDTSPLCLACSPGASAINRWVPPSVLLLRTGRPRKNVSQLIFRSFLPLLIGCFLPCG
jgi:hypothetical protein